VGLGTRLDNQEIIQIHYFFMATHTVYFMKVRDVSEVDGYIT
jgi:hypothetical protein